MPEGYARDSANFRPDSYQCILLPNDYGETECVTAMELDRYQLATEFNLALFERRVANVDDVKALRRLAIRLHATVSHQQKLYQDLIYSKKAPFSEP